VVVSSFSALTLMVHQIPLKISAIMLTLPQFLV
jgi:hypothetical protein